MPTARIVPRDSGLPDPSVAEIVDSIPKLIRTSKGVMIIEVKGVLKRGEETLIETDMDINKSEVNREEEVFLSQEIVTLGELDLSQVESSQVASLTLEGNRLFGRVVKLLNPVAILQPYAPDSTEIPVLDVATHKIVFDKQPEPLVSSLG